MNKKLSLLLVVLLVTSLAVAEDKILQPGDSYKADRVGSPAVSPDGKLIAYSMTKYNPVSEQRESDIYLMPLEGGKSFKLTGMAGGENGYTWHPKKNLLAFSARRGKTSQIYVIDINGGEAQQITNVKTGAYSPQWSPDGSKIAFYSSLGEIYTKEEKEAYGDVIYAKHLRYYHLGPGWDRGKRQRIFVVDAKGGKATQLTDGECSDEGDNQMVWAPCGENIVFVSNREKEWWNTIDTNLYAVNINSKKLTKLTSNVGPDHSPSFSPDGKYLAWRASFEYNYESENYKIMLLEVGKDGAKPQVMSDKFGFNIRSIYWSPDSKKIYFAPSKHGHRHLHYLEVSKPNAFTQVTKGAYLFGGWNIISDSKFVMTRMDSTHSSEIFTLIEGKFKQLTTQGNKFWKDYKLMPSKEIWITNKDGIKVQGWLIKPLGYKEGDKFPMILSIHGGPHGMSSPYMSFRNQLLAHHGIGVLYTNPRGSDGYGQEFADVIQKDWNTAPFSDLMEFVDYVVKNEGADPKKLGVTGGSYGGYMTNWVIGHTDRFAAAITSAGLSNMVSFYGSTDEQFFPEKEMQGSPWESKEAYLFNSPIWHAENFKTPTLIVHGSDDWRVRPEQGRQLFTALQKMGVPSVYVEFPGEQHGVRGRKHSILSQKLYLDWFGHWLQGKEPGLASYITPAKHKYRGK